MSAAMLEIADLDVSYGGVAAVRRLSIEVRILVDPADAQHIACERAVQDGRELSVIGAALAVVGGIGCRLLVPELGVGIGHAINCTFRTSALQ